VNRTWVTGLVLSDTDEPVAGALLEIVEASVPLPEIGLTTDGGGRFSINLPDGTFRLRAHRGHHRGEATLDVPGARDVRIILR
jgi:hypothetical protein